MHSLTGSRAWHPTKARQTAELQILEVPIKGMDCAGCTQHVQPAIAALPGVAQVDVFLSSVKAIVRLDPQRVRLPAIRAAVSQTAPVMLADRTGQWPYAAATAALTLAASTDLGMATYVAGDDTLVVQTSSGAAPPHADDGRLDCVRAVPGITGL